MSKGSSAEKSGSKIGEQDRPGLHKYIEGKANV